MNDHEHIVQADRATNDAVLCRSRAYQWHLPTSKKRRINLASTVLVHLQAIRHLETDHQIIASAS